MRGRGSIVAIFGLLLLGILAAGSWFIMTREDTTCGFCQRPIQPQTKAIAEIDGRRKTVCCPRCAVTEGRQEKIPVRLIAVTDYTTGTKIEPEAAFYVEGSRKMACSHDAAIVDETKHEHAMVFDRCSPGTFAFARREDADAFVRENGGIVVKLKGLLGEDETR